MGWTTAIWLAMAPSAWAGGGPMDVLVIYNADSSDSEHVATQYASLRDVPPSHLCGVPGIDPAARSIAFDEYDATIAATVDACLDGLPDPDLIDILITTRGLPIQVTIPDGFSTSLQAMLQIGHTQRDGMVIDLAGRSQEPYGDNWVASIQNPVYVGRGNIAHYELSNPSASSYPTAPEIVRQSTQPPSFTRDQAGVYRDWDFTNELFLVSRLDGFDFNDAIDLIERGVAADGTHPLAPMTCMAAEDSARGARDPECHYVMQMLTGAGIASQWIETFDGTLSGEEMSSYMTGTTSLQDAIDGNTFAPGTFADNLTSFGAVPNNFFCSEDGSTCPENESQTSIARLVRGGVTGAHGTVAEPLNNCFPGAGMMLLYSMGYGMIESALMTQPYLYWQNLYLGDPLTAPWATRPVVIIDAPAEHPTNWPVTIQAEHPDGIVEIRLYADGVLFDAADGDTLDVVLGGAPGDEVSLLAIAVATNAPVHRPGWPEPDQQPQPDIQGWLQHTITLTPAEPLELDTGSERAEKACGCTAGSTEMTRWMWLLPLALCGVRRQSQAAASTVLPSGA